MYLMLTLEQIRIAELRKATYEPSRDYCPSGSLVSRDYDTAPQLREDPLREKFGELEKRVEEKDSSLNKTLL